MEGWNDRDGYAHSHDVPQGVVLLLHDVGARVGHLGVAGERQLPDPVRKDELLRAGGLVHCDGSEIVRGRECDCENPDFVPLPSLLLVVRAFSVTSERSSPGTRKVDATEGEGTTPQKVPKNVKIPGEGGSGMIGRMSRDWASGAKDEPGEAEIKEGGT